MDPEQIDRPGRHVEPAEPEAPDVEKNPADIELRFGGNQSPEVSSPAKVAKREDPASRDHSGPPLQNLEAEGSDDEAVVQLEPDVEDSDEADVQLDPAEVVSSDEEAVVQLEPEEVESSGDEADVGQLEPAGVGGAAEVVVQQVSTDEESSRASSLEEEHHADEAGAEEPRRIDFEDIRRRVPPNPPLVENVLRALLGEGVDLREQAEAVGEWVAAGQAAIANLHRGVQAMKAAAVNLRDVMVGVGEREAAGRAAIANLHRGAHALEAAVVNLRDAMVAMEAGFGIGGDDNPAADPA